MLQLHRQSNTKDGTTVKLFTRDHFGSTEQLQEPVFYSFERSYCDSVFQVVNNKTRDFKRQKFTLVLTVVFLTLLKSHLDVCKSFKL